MDRAGLVPLIYASRGASSLIRPRHCFRRRANDATTPERAGARSVFVLVLLATLACSTHTAARRTVPIFVSLARGDQFVPGRVTASLPDGTVVASARQGGRPGDDVNFILRRGRTYTFRG